MNCYNSSEHLREALQSVMAQTFTDFEIVFWDNCSTDESPAIANSFTCIPISVTPAPLRFRSRNASTAS